MTGIIILGAVILPHWITTLVRVHHNEGRVLPFEEAN